jgi:hypothetical protein
MLSNIPLYLHNNLNINLIDRVVKSVRLWWTGCGRQGRRRILAGKLSGDNFEDREEGGRIIFKMNIRRSRL